MIPPSPQHPLDVSQQEKSSRKPPEVQWDPARPWMEAVEMQYSLLGDLERNIVRIQQTHQYGDPTDIINAWRVEQQLLRRAECFTWEAESIAACRSAARTVPHDTALQLDRLPARIAWWYFSAARQEEKLQRGEDVTLAFLYGSRINYPMVAMHAYVIEKGHRSLPTRNHVWYWQEGTTFSEMIGRADQSYEDYLRRYKNKLSPQAQAFPKEAYLKVVADLSLFFLAACAWLQQRIPILTFDRGPIERHRRKQLMREQKLDQPPNDVKIVQLRRLESHQEVHQGPGKVIDWACRWTVDGHFRNQPCGPKHSDRKLIWIMPHVKGPLNRPLKIPSHKVFVVNR